MASSGSFQTSAYNSKCLLFEWWVNSQDVTNNKTNIGYRLKGYNGSGYHTSRKFLASNQW